MWTSCGDLLDWKKQQKANEAVRKEKKISHTQKNYWNEFLCLSSHLYSYFTHNFMTSADDNEKKAECAI